MIRERERQGWEEPHLPDLLGRYLAELLPRAGETGRRTRRGSTFQQCT
jgi:hypothetical protein